MRAACFNVMVIAGVSSLLFNGNPFLRFDAYYVASDLLEIPNLAMRANQYLGWWVQRRCIDSSDPNLGLAHRAEQPVQHGEVEKSWEELEEKTREILGYAHIT